MRNSRVHPKTTVPFVGLAIMVVILAGIFSSCTPSVSEIAGVYSGCIQETADRRSEYFLQIYVNGEFAQRITPYELPGKNIFRRGTWNIDGNLVVLISEAEKDQRFYWEHTSIRSESSSQAFPNLDRDQVSLKKVSW